MRKDRVKELRKREREEGEREEIEKRKRCVCRGDIHAGGKKTTKVNSPPGFTGKLKIASGQLHTYFSQPPCHYSIFLPFSLFISFFPSFTLCSISSRFNYEPHSIPTFGEGRLQVIESSPRVQGLRLAASNLLLEQ